MQIIMQESAALGWQRSSPETVFRNAHTHANRSPAPEPKTLARAGLGAAKRAPFEGKKSVRLALRSADISVRRNAAPRFAGFTDPPKETPSKRDTSN